MSLDRALAIFIKLWDSGVLAGWLWMTADEVLHAPTLSDGMWQVLADLKPSHYGYYVISVALMVPPLLAMWWLHKRRKDRSVGVSSV